MFGRFKEKRFKFLFCIEQSFRSYISYAFKTKSLDVISITKLNNNEDPRSNGRSEFTRKKTS